MKRGLCRKCAHVDVLAMLAAVNGPKALRTGGSAALAHPLQLPQPVKMRDAAFNGGLIMRNLGIIFAASLLIACTGTGKEKIQKDSASNPDGIGEDSFIEDAAGDESNFDIAGEDLTIPDDFVGPKDAAPQDVQELPANCCFVDSDCDPGNVCVGYDGGPWPEAGTCQAAPEEGRCWSDADCPFPVDHCEQATICGCGEKCALEPGYCLHVIDPPNCCQTDEECGFGLVCVGAGMGAGGTCLQAPAGGDCFGDNDCLPAEYCINETICSCDMNCISEAGVCIPFGVACCFGNADCEDTELCAPTSNEPGPGVCKEQPPEGLCWLDAQCKPGQSCKGADICGCDQDCFAPDQPGECLTPCADLDCCCDEQDCGPDYECVYLDAGNVCLPIQPAGMCWQDTDCGDSEYCFGANPCACAWDCDGDGGDIPGTCKPTGGDMCCMTDADCPQFFVGEPMFCLLEDGNPFIAGTCQPMAPFGKCWNDDDCYMIQTCEGNGFCPCGMDCQAPGTTMGDCSPLPTHCCYTDADCEAGSVCRGDSAGQKMPGSCVPDPNGPQCLGDAQCCWDNGDCGGGTCNGASVCGCIELCPVCGACQADQMGWCS